MMKSCYPLHHNQVSATLLLTLVGILTLKKAWNGFSNDVVLSVAVLGIVARGVENTRAVEQIFRKLLGKPKGYWEAALRLFLPAIVLNVAVSNTANMSILMPIIERWSEDIGLSKNFFLMPLSFLLLISGTVAIFATSSNLIAQGQMERYHQVPFTTFEIAPVALCATAVTLVGNLVFVPLLFGAFQEEADAIADAGAGGERSRRTREVVLLEEVRRGCCLFFILSRILRATTWSN